MNDGVDAKVLCFLQEIIANSTTDIKSYFSERICDQLVETGSILPLDVKPDNPDVGLWITDNALNQTMDQA